MFSVEVACSSSWIPAFFAVSAGSKHGKGYNHRANAAVVIRQVLFSAKSKGRRTLVVDPGLLRDCPVPWRKSGCATRSIAGWGACMDATIVRHQMHWLYLAKRPQMEDVLQ